MINHGLRKYKSSFSYFLLLHATKYKQSYTVDTHYVV